MGYGVVRVNFGALHDILLLPDSYELLHVGVDNQFSHVINLYVKSEEIPDRQEGQSYYIVDMVYQRNDGIVSLIKTEVRDGST